MKNFQNGYKEKEKTSGNYAELKNCKVYFNQLPELTFSTASVVTWDTRWSNAYLTTPHIPNARPYIFDLEPIERTTARATAESLKRTLQREAIRFVGLPLHEFKPRMEYIIRDWLVYNANYREWTVDLSEIQHENSPSSWKLALTLDRETVEIEFTITT